MLTATELLADLRGRGYRVELVGDGLRVSPKGLSPHLRAEVARHSAALAEALRAETDADRAHWDGLLDRAARVDPRFAFVLATLRNLGAALQGEGKSLEIVAGKMSAAEFDLLAERWLKPFVGEGARFPAQWRRIADAA